MNRRTFLAQSLVAAASGVAMLGAQAATRQRPKLVLFGMCVIDPTDPTKLVAHIPELDLHRAFAVGRASHLNALGLQSKPIDQALSLIHDDIAAHADAMACFEKQELVASSTGRNDFPGQFALPSLTALAKEIRPGNYSLKWPARTSRLTMSGGSLRLPGKFSNAVGTHGHRFQFRAEQRDIGRPLRLTDVLVFEANASELVVSAGGNKDAVLRGGDVMWLVNIPTDVSAQKLKEKQKCGVSGGEAWNKCLNEIDDAHHVFSLLDTTQLPSSITALPTSYFERENGGGEFPHPCVNRSARVPGAALPLIPPDTDPCFISQV